MQLFYDLLIINIISLSLEARLGSLIAHFWILGRSLSSPGLQGATETGCSTYARPWVVLLHFLMKPWKDSGVELNKSVTHECKK